MTDILLGIIGVGSMGRPMAENLIKAGYTVNVCDIRVETLVERFPGLFRSPMPCYRA